MSTFREITLLIGRLLLGVILIAHGWDKLSNLAGTTEGFVGMGIPVASATAPLAGIIELVGGILLILGLGTRIVGVIVFVQMLIAALLVHLPYGVMVANNGWELVGAIGAGVLILAGVGAGAYSIDALIARRKTTSPDSPNTSANSAAPVGASR